MSRYDIPGPKCNHAFSKRVIRVASHAEYTAAEPFISTWICERPACLADADECVRAFARREPIHVRSTKR